MRAVRKTTITILGWILLVVGLAAIPLPGPGALIMLSGLIVLSQEYDWAKKRVEPATKAAIEGAKQGVASYPRIALSAVSASAIVAAGVVWWASPEIPEIWIFGPNLPFGGWATGSSLIFSGLVAWGLLIYSVKRWSGEARAARKAGRSPSRVE